MPSSSQLGNCQFGEQTSHFRDQSRQYQMSQFATQDFMHYSPYSTHINHSFLNNEIDMNGGVKKEMRDSKHILNDIENMYIHSEGSNFHLMDELDSSSNDPLSLPLPLPSVGDMKDSDNFDFDMNSAWLDNFTPVEHATYSGHAFPLNLADYA